MRYLFILQGLPASGKSTFIRTNGLQQNTLSYDAMRDMFSIVAHDSMGQETLSIRKGVQSDVARTVERAAEYRMSNGDTLFIDNTNTSRNALKPWLALVRKYAYTPIVLSFGNDLSVEDHIERDMFRGGRSYVGPETIRRMAESLKKYTPHPEAEHVYEDHWSRVKSLLACPYKDLSQYEEVVVVGDVQGCGNALEKMIEKIGPFSDTSRHWIFVGDFFDRGPTPEKVLDILSRPCQNVTLIEGNHERSVRQTLMGTREFDSSRKTTLDVIPQKRHKELLKLVTRPVSHLAFQVDDRMYFVSHAGSIPNAKASELAYGEELTGLNSDYDYYVGAGDRAKTYFNIGTYDDFWKDLNYRTKNAGLAATFFGHRNDQDDVETPREQYPYLVPLENKVEFEGTLVAARMTKDGTIRYEHTKELCDKDDEFLTLQ